MKNINYNTYIIILLIFWTTKLAGQVNLNPGTMFQHPTYGFTIRVQCNSLIPNNSKVLFRRAVCYDGSSSSYLFDRSETTGIYRCEGNQGYLSLQGIAEITNIELRQLQVVLQTINCSIANQNKLIYIYSGGSSSGSNDFIDNSCFTPGDCDINVVANIVDLTCSSNGSISLTSTGGTGTLSYKWADLTSTTLKTRTNLSTGTYKVTVSDTRNCVLRKEFEIKNACNVKALNCDDYIQNCGPSFVAYANSILSNRTACTVWNGACDQAEPISRLGGVKLGAHDLKGYKLAVTDGIASTSLLVNIDSGVWPDYVFTDKYKMLTLPEVEYFIKQKKHLPNTPSAKEIQEKGGFEIGEVAINHQEKIEEIYLHLIDIKKEADVVEKEMIVALNENLTLTLSFINSISVKKHLAK